MVLRKLLIVRILQNDLVLCVSENDPSNLAGELTYLGEYTGNHLVK